MEMSRTGSNGFNASLVSELYQLTKSLQNAIRSGDENSAKALVQKLTLMKAPVVINLEEATPPSTNIRLRVQFEDRTLSGPFIDLHVNPNTTIGAVKCLIYDKLKFPPEVQRCIVGKRMRHNKETLASCGLTHDGCVIFVYILSAETVGLHMADDAQDNEIILQGAVQSENPFPRRCLDYEGDGYQQVRCSSAPGSSDVVPSKATSLKHWAITDRLLKRKLVSQESSVVVDSQQPVSDKKARPSLLRGPKVSTATASQSSDPLRHSISLADNVEQIYNLGAGTSQDSAVPHVISPTPFLPNATISSPQAQVSPDSVIPPHTVNANLASIPAPTADESNVQQSESSHSMTSASHSGDGDDVNAAAAENTPAEEVPWSCDVCTYLNHGCMTICELCSTARPGMATDGVQDITDVVWIDEGPQQMNVNDPEFDAPEWMNGPLPLAETSRLTNSYNDLLQMETCHVVANCDSFKCPICLDKCEPGHGVVLRECLHMFCSECLSEHVRLADSAIVKCPFNNGDYACTSTILDREIKALVCPDTYQKYLQRSVQEAECRTPNSYHCATPNCPGWCTFEDDVNSFFCYACSHDNCLTCRAIHEDMDCADHQRQMKAKFQTDHAARMAQASLEELLKFGEALKCPTCGIVIMKKEGCDWIQCTMCKTEICWVTRQARWGPKGTGDTSGGCKCRVNGKLCHPDCQNCH